MGIIVLRSLCNTLIRLKNAQCTTTLIRNQHDLSCNSGQMRIILVTKSVTKLRGLSY